MCDIYSIFDMFNYKIVLNKSEWMLCPFSVPKLMDSLPYNNEQTRIYDTETKKYKKKKIEMKRIVCIKRINLEHNH